MTSEFKKLKHLQQKGFTLVEIAIVLIIFGLMLAMFLSPLSAQRELKNRAQTQRLLNEAKDALIGFALVHGYLPCADADALPDGIADYETDGTCKEKKLGVLPWNTLGIEATDAWNNYFSYRVDETFANNKTLFSIQDAEGSTGITINGEHGALISTNSRPLVVVLSHGANGFGATNTNQSTTNNKEVSPTSADEIENANDTITFVSHPPTAAGSNAGEFDDMLIWISPKVLINRMIMAERLP